MSSLAATILPRSPARRPTGVLVLLALLELGRQVVLLFAAGAQPWDDSAGYWRMAGLVAQGDVWLLQEETASRTPGYPWLLGFVRWLADSNALAVVIVVQHLLVWLTSRLTVDLTWKLSQSPRAAIAAAILCFASTARPLFANWILTEVAATFCVMLAAWALVNRDGQVSTARLLLAGCVLGVAILIRPASLAFAPALLVVALLPRDGRSLRRRLAMSLLVVLAIALPLLPWVIRNRAQHDRWMLIAFTGRELWTVAFSPWPGVGLTLEENSSAETLLDKLGGLPNNWRNNAAMTGALRNSGFDDVATDDLMSRVAGEALRQHPGRAVGTFAARCATFWYCWDWETELRADRLSPAHRDPWRDQRMWHFPQWTEAVMAVLRMTPERFRVTSVLAMLLAWLGVVRMIGRVDARGSGIAIFVVLAGLTVLTAALEIPNYRYRSVAEPLLIVGVSLGWFARPRHIAASQSQAPPGIGDS